MRFVLVLAFAFVFARPALADESVEGKFLGYADGEVKLAKVERRLLLDPEAPLAAELAGFRLGADRLDRKGRSNVRVTGTTVVLRGVGQALRVTGVVKLADDPSPEEARAAAEAALDARRARVASVADALALAKDYRDVAHVTSKAIAVLGEFASDPGARAALVELGAVLHRDRWVSSDELHAQRGYVKVNGRWVTALHAELEEEIAKQRALARERAFSLRIGGDAYEKAAAQKRLVAGMVKPEATIARGFPKHVERVTDAAGTTWDQWVFDDGTRAYFMRGANEADSLLVSWR